MSEPLQSFPEITPQDVDALLVFLNVFQQPDFKTGEWITADGQMPYFKPDSAVEAFHTALLQHHWVVPVDWGEWLQTHPEPATFDHLAGADLEYIRYLLTSLVRADRFSEGTLAKAIENKDITAVLRRLKVIRLLNKNWP